MIYKLKVHPNYFDNKIEHKPDYIKIYVKEKPENNKANIAVIKLLSKHFNTSQAKIKLRGLTSKNKIIEIK